MKMKFLLAAFVFFTGSAGLFAADCVEARALYEKRDFIGAEKNLFEIPGNLDLPCIKLLAESQLAQGRLKEASVSFGRVSELSHQDKDSLRKLARLYGWTDRYSEAAAAYDAVIALDPADFSAVVEKARVLGWDKRYAEASSAYTSAFEASKQEWIEEERLGKEDMWEHRTRTGLAHLKKAAELNDADTEALSDLAQFYSGTGEYERAQPYYDLLLKAEPYHTAALRSEKKNAVYRDGFKLSAGTDLWEAHSPGRKIGVKYLNYSASVSKRLDRHFSVAGTGADGIYSFKGVPLLEERGTGLTLAYNGGSEGGAAASYTKKIFVQDIRSRESYSVSAWKKALEDLNFTASAVRENLINNFTSVRESRDISYRKLRTDWDADGAFLAGADWSGGEVNDGNQFKIYGADARLTYDDEPEAFYSVLRYEKRHYKRHSDSYFAPNDYNTYSFTQVLKKNIGGEGLYYGANDTYYELSCAVLYDESPFLLARPSVAFYKDFSSRLNFKAGWALTVSHYYRDNYYYVHAGLLF